MPYGTDQLLTLRQLAKAMGINHYRLHRAVQDYGPNSIHPTPEPLDAFTAAGKTYRQWARWQIPEWRKWFADRGARHLGPGSRPVGAGMTTSMQARLLWTLQSSAHDLAGTVVSLRRVTPEGMAAQVQTDLDVLDVLEALEAHGLLGSTVLRWIASPAVREYWHRYPPRVRQEKHRNSSTRTWSAQGRRKAAASLLRRRLPRHLGQVVTALEKIEAYLAVLSATDAARTRQALAGGMASYVPKPDNKPGPRLLPPADAESETGE